jgi:hypothetical protein
MVVTASAKAKDYLAKLNLEEELLKIAKFDGKVMEFYENHNEFNCSSLLGVLDSVAINLDFDNLSELKFASDQVTQDYMRCIHLFKTENENNIAFYINTSYEMCFVTFENTGKVLKRLSVPSPKRKADSSHKHPDNTHIFELKVTRLKTGFLLYVMYNKNGHSDDNVPRSEYVYEFGNNQGFLCILDENLNLVKQISLSYQISHMAANNSIIICVDQASKYYCYTSLLIPMLAKALKKKLIKHAPLGSLIEGFEMNDSNIFILLKSSLKLKIFETKMFTLIKEINTRADRLKLRSTESIFLFDSKDQVVYWYDQHSFERLSEKNISDQLLNERDLLVNSDKTNHVAFYNSTSMKSLVFLNYY